jgi:DNA modification methylase
MPPAELSIEYKALSALIPYQRNARTHSDAQIEQIATSIKEFGWTNPVLLDGANGIIAGHARVKAAERLGMTEIPCIDFSRLTEEQKRAYILADNQLALNAGWDELLLTAELAGLKDLGYDIGLIGFGQDELDELFSRAGMSKGLTDPDEVPDAPSEAATLPGDLWALGRHRLLCADSTQPEPVEKLLRGRKADMVFTDPPYNIDYKGGGKHTNNKILNDKSKAADFENFLAKVFSNYSRHTKSGAGIYIFHASRTQKEFEKALSLNGYEIKNQLIWNKPAAALGWGDYRWKHEPFFYAGKKGEKTQFYGDRTHSTVWDFQKTEQQLLNWARRQKKLESEGKTTIWSMRRDNVNEYVHPTQKPVELIGYAIINSSKGEDIILDLFGGSGSTLIACETTNRICHTMELDPRYCDVIVERWQRFTGKSAILEGEGHTFEEIRAERAKID